MLAELRVRNLGVIRDQAVLLGPGLTALTGETGAGKTLLVDAISLLVGGPSDPGLVAPGADEAHVEGRFVVGPGLARQLGLDDNCDEVVLARVIPAGGRSRAYVDGRMVASARLAEIGARLVDIHGQHAHQSLLSPAAQRRAVDGAAGVDAEDVGRARRRLRELRQGLDELGGDPRERARQMDLLRYQLAEIERAGVDDPDEDDRLQVEEELLSDASGLVEAAAAARQAMVGDDGAVERVGVAVSLTAGRRPLSDLHDRLVAAQEELADVAAEARRLAESVEDDPGRLAAIGERRRILSEVRRKYGPALADVVAYRDRLGKEIEELAAHDERAAALTGEITAAEAQLDEALRRAWAARRQAVPGLARAVEGELQALALPRARFAIEVDDDPAEERVTWFFSANPGSPMQPLSKVASGGELARVMLASRLVVGPAGSPGAGRTAEGPQTLIFDEVDAGIGGEAAHAVGRALAALGGTHQVLVVTHLAQVASFARAHLSVTKVVSAGAAGEEQTVARAAVLTGADRIAELARMLAGRPDSASALSHAEELLREAGARP